MTRLTPLEVQRASFPRRFKGFDPDAVHLYLGSLAEQMEEDARSRGDLRAQVEQLSGQVEEYRRQAEALSQALVTAQKAADNTVARAEMEAQRILSEAQAFSERLVEEASRRVENIELTIAQLRSRRRAARADLNRLAEILVGAAKDDETVEQREPATPQIAFIRPRLNKAE